MKIEDLHIGFVGFGHMAGILVRAIEAARLISRSRIVFHRRNSALIHSTQEAYGITSSGLEALAARSDLIFVCVRPEQIEPVLKGLRGLDLSGKTLVSILAGIEMADFENVLGAVSVARAMPNAGLAVGEGLTTLSFNDKVDGEARSHVNILFRSMGRTVELPEKFMDLATGMAGSGPAFVFALIESLARLGEKEGVAYETALIMASQTFLGAARVLLESKISIAEEMRKIAIPGGTTEAGLKVLENLELGARLQAVVLAARDRAQQLRSSK